MAGLVPAILKTNPKWIGSTERPSMGSSKMRGPYWCSSACLNWYRSNMGVIYL